MQNKVVHTLARAMQELGAPTVRFNFRGVGASAGGYDGGAGELEDALAACAWARRRWSCESLLARRILVRRGHRAGGGGDGAAAALVTVAPPVGRLIVAPVLRPACPWLVVQGDRDELVDVATVRRWVVGFDAAAAPRAARGAEHFFHGRLAELRAGVLVSCADSCRGLERAA